VKLFFFFEETVADRVAKLSAVGDGNVKPILLQAWTGPDGSRRLRLPDIKTVGT